MNGPGNTNGHAAPPPAGTAPLPRCLLVGEVADPDGRLDALLRQELGLDVRTAGDGAAALKTLTDQPHDIILVDLVARRARGVRFLEELRGLHQSPAVIGVASPTAVREAVEALRLGARDVLLRPLDPAQLLPVLRRILQERGDRPQAGDDGASGRYHFANLLGTSAAMEPVFALIGKVARSRTTLLIEGETGTGKEQVARAIHAAAPDRTGPFLGINCAALPLTLLESELFGHEKGSFTGADTQRTGRLELADRGTLFLDEVSDIPPPMQAKLLRFLQERRFERVGGVETLEVDVRVIGATNRCLRRLVRAGKFREDLYYRLNVVKIDVPPLRERPEDIPLLANHFAARYAPAGAGALPIAAETMEVLLDHPWPGNVRELENVIERCCVAARSGPIRPEHLPPEIFKPRGGAPHFHIDLSRPLPELLRELVAAVEQHYLRKALRKSQGRIGRCAEICGLSRRSVTTKLHEYNITKLRYDEAR
jgi:DNA-binding NtrC family response regulator